MNGDNGAPLEPNFEPKIFAAVITPHRSLGSTGFLILMLCIGALSFACGIMFLLIGAWPVFGFLGLDVLLIYIAFRANFRAARAYEEVTVTASELTVRKVNQHGKVPRMDAQSALGAARPHRTPGIRHRAAVSGLARRAAVDRGFPEPRREGKLRAGALDRFGRSQARADKDGDGITASVISGPPKAGRQQ